ncbi:MAG: hypothetical protein QM802_19875 [Agriterribacter sp.]
MIYEELKLPLPVYDRFEKQYRFSKGSAINFVIATKDRILPFQFLLDETITEDDITSWTINKPDAARTEAYDLTSQISKLELAVTSSGSTYIVFKGVEIGLLMEHGKYHMEFVIKSLIYFSEQFEVRCESPMWDDIESIFSRIDYDNDGCDLGPILYQTGYKNRVYLDTSIHKENPTIEEEGSNDGAGNFVATSQKYIDNLNLEYVCPYYLADALVLMSIHKKKTHTTPNTLYTGDMKNVKPTVVQEDGSWNYRLTMPWQQDSIYLNAPCCNNIALSIIPPFACGRIDDVEIKELRAQDAIVSWDLYGDIGRALVEWEFVNEDCPQSGSAYVLPTTIGIITLPVTQYIFNKPPYKGLLVVNVTPQCSKNDIWVSGETKTASKIMTLGTTCTSEPEEPGGGTSQVFIENNTTDITITNVTGIPGFTCSPVAPMSGQSGTHAPFGGGSPSITVYYDPWPSYNHISIKINGVSIACGNDFPYTLSKTFLLSTGAIADGDDITIELAEGDCP